MHGADLNCTAMSMGSFFSTPLYIIITYQHWTCFHYLLLSGANPDYHCNMTEQPRSHTQNTRESLYHTAIRHKCPVKYVKLLYEFNAGIHYTDGNDKLASELDVQSDAQKESIDYIQHCMSEYHCYRWTIRSVGRGLGGRLKSLDFYVEVDEKNLFGHKMRS